MGSEGDQSDVATGNVKFTRRTQQIPATVCVSGDSSIAGNQVLGEGEVCGAGVELGCAAGAAEGAAGAAAPSLANVRM